MKSPITRIAAAAVIAIVAGLVVLPLMGGSVTYAKVVQSILKARTVAFDFVAGDEHTSPVMHDVVVESRIRRTFSNMPTILVLDLDSARMLTLDPPSKGALYVDIQGPLVEGTRSVLNLVREALAGYQDRLDQVQDLGRRRIDGVEAVGFQDRGLTIWADPDRAVPVRIELHGNQSVTILKNIIFDLPVDESLVSMDVPTGYTQHKTDLSMGDLTEQDLVEALGIWARVMNDGVFPDTVTVEAFMQQMPVLGQKIGSLGLSEEEGTRMGMAVGKGMGFLQILDYQGEWHYAGKGVALGDARTAIFWYRKGDAKTYRVVYGDLRVEDVGLDQVPGKGGIGQGTVAGSR